MVSCSRAPSFDLLSPYGLWSSDEGAEQPALSRYLGGPTGLSCSAQNEDRHALAKPDNCAPVARSAATLVAACARIHCGLLSVDLLSVV